MEGWTHACYLYAPEKQKNIRKEKKRWDNICLNISFFEILFALIYIKWLLRPYWSDL